MGETTKMPHLRNTSKESHQERCGLIPQDLFLMELCLPKWVWSRSWNGLEVIPMHLPPNVLDEYIPCS